MRGTALFLGMLLVPAGAIAQEATHSFAALSRQGVITPGESIWITCDLAGEGDYEEIEARLGGLTGFTITVEVEDLPRGTWPGVVSTDYGYRFEIPESRVSRIQLRPSVRRWGLLIGTAAGIGVGIAVGAVCAADNAVPEECYGIWVPLMSAAGAGAGVITDAVRKRGAREVVYLGSGAGTSSFNYSVAPLISSKRKGALFTITW